MIITNFKSADCEMHEAVKVWNVLTNDPDLQLAGIKQVFYFEPTRCGSANGVWERLIAKAKKLLVSGWSNRQMDKQTDR